MTPLKWAKQSGHKHIVEFLEVGGATNFDRDPSKTAVKEFKAAAESESFKHVLQRIKGWTERDAKPWTKRKGVFVAMIGGKSWARIAAEFGLPAPTMEKSVEDNRKIQEIQDRLQEVLLSMGAQILVNDLEQRRYLIMPTADPLAPLIAVGTNGINYGHDTEAVVQWFRKTAESNPFRLTGCSFDWCSGIFTKSIVDPESLAKSMLEFCPDLDDGDDTISGLANELQSDGRFYFWWD